MKSNRLSPTMRVSPFLLLLLGLLLSLHLLTNTAQANRSFQMQQIEITAEVLPDASMRVTEKLTIDFSGKWNGFFIRWLPPLRLPLLQAGVKRRYAPG